MHNYTAQQHIVIVHYACPYDYFVRIPAKRFTYRETFMYWYGEESLNTTRWYSDFWLFVAPFILPPFLQTTSRTVVTANLFKRRQRLLNKALH